MGKQTALVRAPVAVGAGVVEAMQTKFDKIIERVISGHIHWETPFFDSELYILGYPLTAIHDDPRLQDRLYSIFFPTKLTPASCRTMAVEDIRSR